MSNTRDFFDPRVLLSSKNPFYEYGSRTHNRVFEAFDKTVRVQLSFIEDLLDMNRKRFEALYAGDGIVEKITTHQDLAVAACKRTATWAGDLQEAAFDLRDGVWNAAKVLMPMGAAESTRSKSGKKGASHEN